MVLSLASLLLLIAAPSIISIDYHADTYFQTSDQAKSECPSICKDHGGWNGNWSGIYRSSQENDSVCGCNGTEREKCLEREGSSLRAEAECNKYSN